MTMTNSVTPLRGCFNGGISCGTPLLTFKGLAGILSRGYGFNFFKCITVQHTRLLTYLASEQVSAARSAALSIAAFSQAAQ